MQIGQKSEKHNSIAHGNKCKHIQTSSDSDNQVDWTDCNSKQQSHKFQITTTSTSWYTEQAHYNDVANFRAS